MATEKLRIELQAITAKAEKDIRRFQGSVNKAAKAVQMLGSSGKRSMRPLGEGLSAASVNASEFEKSMAAANARVIAFGASAGLIYQVQRALKETVKATIEVEKSFANINIVLNASQATLQKFGNTLFTISGQTGQSFRDVSEAATELARQGLSMEKTLSRTKDALILTRLTGMGAVESVESLTAAVNSFSSAGVTSAQVINKMAKVDQAFAVSSEDLAKSIARVGSSAVDAGVSLDQLLAITTAVQQRTARGGAVIGNAFKTIFTRIGRTDVQEKLNAIGVATKDMQGNMLGATQVLQNLSQRFQELTKNQQNNIAESVAGVFQVNILRAALGDLSNKYGVYNKALLDSASATDEAYRKNEELNKTLDSLVNKTLANLTKAGSGIGELTLKPALEKVLGSVNEVIEGFGEGGRFEKFGQGMGKEILEGLGRFISGPGLAMGAIAVGKLLYNFSKFAKQAVGGIMELNANVANRKNLEALVTQELLKQPDIIARIERNQTTVEKEAADILSLYKRQNTEAEKLKMTTAAIAGEMAAINRSRVAGGGGRAGGGFGRRRASGFIPNFASEDQERIEASLGGYQAGAIKKMTIPGEGPVLYNSAETVKRFPGMTQPAIMPPEGSRAGAAYKTSFSDAHGFDPYKGQGFVPNFARVIINYADANKATLKSYAKKGDEKAKAEINRRDKEAANKVAKTYDLKTKASMLVPKEGYYDSEVEKRFETPFQVGKTKYNKVKFSAHGLRRDASKHLKDKNSSIAEIIDDSLYSAGKNLLNAFDPEFVKNAKITKNEIETLVDQAGGKGARESLKGAFFEGVIRKLIFSKEKSQPLDPKTGTLDTLITKDIKALFQGPIESTHGDFKANADIKLKSAFASQALKNFGASFPKPKRKSKGFVPSFSSAISEAIEREKSAGIPSSSIRIGSDSRLSSKANPMGLGVYNTKDEPAGLGQGIDRSIRIGQDPKTHGAAKGFVPNFIAGPGLSNLVRAVPEVVRGFSKVAASSSKVAKSSGKVEKAFGSVKGGASKLKNTFANLSGGGGMGGLGASMMGSYLGQSSLGEGDSPRAGLVSALSSGLEVGGSLAMVHPVLGLVAGLGVAGAKSIDPLQKLLGLKHEETNQTEDLNNYLQKLTENQKAASQGFVELSEKLSLLSKVGGMSVKDISGAQGTLLTALDKGSLSKTGYEGDLNEEGKALKEKILKASTAEEFMALQSEVDTHLQGRVKTQEERNKQVEAINSIEGHFDTSKNARNQKTHSSRTTLVGLKGGGLTETFKDDIIDRYSDMGDDGVSAYTADVKSLQNKDLSNNEKIKKLATLLTGETSNKENQDIITAISNKVSSLASKTLKDHQLGDGKLVAEREKIALDKIINDMSEEINSESGIAKSVELKSEEKQNREAAAAKALEDKKKQDILNRQRVNTEAALRGGSIYDAQIAANKIKVKEDKDLLERQRKESKVLQGLDLQKKLTDSRAKATMGSLGAAEASYQAQENYIEAFRAEKQLTAREKFSGQINVEKGRYRESAEKILNSSVLSPDSQEYKTQKAAITDFSELLQKASDSLEENGKIDENIQSKINAKRKELLINIEKEKRSKESGSKDRIAADQEMLKSLKSLEDISTGFESQKLTIDNQVADMETANKDMKDVREDQLRNARIFNKKLRDEQQETIYILAKQRANEANFLSSQGRITATEAARLKADFLESRRNKFGMKDIVSESKKSASMGLQESLGYNQRNFVNDIQSSFKEIGDTFKSGMADAIKGMVTGATDFKSAMASVFGTIADKTADKGIEMGINAMMNAGMNMFKKSSGGPIKKYQTGGLVTGGSGVKDDVLTMMQGGEYVIRKSAVNQIPGGVSTLDAINRSAGGEMPRFAAGGSANLSLKRDFKYTGKDKKRPTGGHFDVDSRMSTLGFFGAQGTKTDMFDRQKRLESYKDYVAQEKKRRADIIAKDLAERKGRLMKAYVSAAMAIGAQAISGAMNNQSTETVGGGDRTGSFDIEMFPNGRSAGGEIPRFAAGGSANQAHGRIPGMVMGGEYIMSPQATQQYGSGFMAQLNRGQLPGFAEGGLVGGEKAGSEDEESKAKETSSTTNNVNISISIDKTGNAETSEGESASEGQNDEDVTKSKEFSQAIKSVVLEEIVKQQRPGGLLRDNDSKG